MKQTEPFRIDIPQGVLDDLKTRIANTRWTDEPGNAGWQYGTNPAYLRELTAYWLHDYDWRKQEAALNQFPQYKAEIDGIVIHFIHVKGRHPSSMPLLLTHGWPDSFYRYHKIIPLLTDFDLVIPSIPGFGFSDHRALSSEATAVLWMKLMTEMLGYAQFGAAGGDLGSDITRILAFQYPDHVIAIHLTDVGYPTGTENFSTMSVAEQEFAEFCRQWWCAEGGYNSIQSTKPQTLGAGLNDSPVGLASWILEKFYTWSDCHADIESCFTKDELLTNIMIYWVTQTINSSIRTYLVNARARYAKPGGFNAVGKSEPPAAVASFRGDAPVPREWAERRVNLHKFTRIPRGGHFAAMEEPVLWAGEVRSFFTGVTGELGRRGALPGETGWEIPEELRAAMIFI